MRVTLSIALCAAALVACQRSAPSSSQAPEADSQVPDKPVAEWTPPAIRNVLLITIDTLRADMLGVHGGPARTPNLDKLARDGWWFENAISASMLTNPSHASIMTSLYPRDHGVYDNESGIHQGLGTIAQQLKSRGMSTGAVIGFPHLNPNVANLGRGFDEIELATRKERRADETSEVALSILDRLRESADAAGAGTFMWLHYVDPHAPYEPPDSHPPAPVTSDKPTPLAKAKQVAPSFQKNNPWFKEAFDKYGSVEALRQRYIAEIEATDAGLGQLLAGLEKRNMARDTAIVITSDHGENLGEHELYFHHGGLYRETVHVPLIVGFAPGVASPARVRGLVETVDIAPTILELLDLPRWEPMRGRSLVGIVSGRSSPRDVAISEHMMAQLVAARSLDASLILHRKNSQQFPNYRFQAGKQEHYDLTRDPRETAQRSPEGQAYDDLTQALRKYLGAGLRFSARPAVDQDRDSLRALGYIE